jgi:hypothetical protein
MGRPCPNLLKRFFLSFAQSSCENEKVRPKVAGKPAHLNSLGRLRVNSAVQNFEEFGKAFQMRQRQAHGPGEILPGLVTGSSARDELRGSETQQILSNV